jgi:hypothetical protein
MASLGCSGLRPAAGPILLFVPGAGFVLARAGSRGQGCLWEVVSRVRTASGLAWLKTCLLVELFAGSIFIRET